MSSILYEALQSLQGADCPGLSASTITRLIQQWQEEYKGWSKCSLSEKKYVYLWADGVYYNTGRNQREVTSNLDGRIRPDSSGVRFMPPTVRK